VPNACSVGGWTLTMAEAAVHPHNVARQMIISATA
jgi:hypothetical protein